MPNLSKTMLSANRDMVDDNESTQEEFENVVRNIYEESNDDVYLTDNHAIHIIELYVNCISVKRIYISCRDNHEEIIISMDEKEIIHKINPNGLEFMHNEFTYDQILEDKKEYFKEIYTGMNLKYISEEQFFEIIMVALMHSVTDHNAKFEQDMWRRF